MEGSCPLLGLRAVHPGACALSLSRSLSFSRIFSTRASLGSHGYAALSCWAVAWPCCGTMRHQPSQGSRLVDPSVRSLPALRVGVPAALTGGTREVGLYCSVEMPALPERPQTVPAGMQREPPLSAQLRNMQLKEAGPNPVDKEVPQVLSRLQMVVDAGGIEPLMKLCTPPGGLVAPAPDDGKKKKKGKGKKGKAPPLEPGKEDAYQVRGVTL
jgi:hypothetical protein